MLRFGQMLVYRSNSLQLKKPLEWTWELFHTGAPERSWWWFGTFGVCWLKCWNCWVERYNWEFLQIISTWCTRTKLRTLWWVEAGTCITDCPRDWNLCFCSPNSTSLFSRPMFCLVMLRSSRSCDSVVDSWVALSDHPGSVLASLGWY
jgi:hypothetical protein